MKGIHTKKQRARDATRAEIEELARQMKEFGVDLSDVADNCPKQQRTLDACRKALQYARENPELLDDLLKTKDCPSASWQPAVAWNAKRWNGTANIWWPCC